MKNKIKTLLAVALSVAALNAYATQTADEQAANLIASFDAAVNSGNKTISQKRQAVAKWNAENASTLSAMTSLLPDMTAYNACFVAARIATALNGVNAVEWTEGVSMLRAYNTTEYMARCATLEEVQTYAARADANIAAVRFAAIRLATPSLITSCYEARLGRGTVDQAYEKWFKEQVNASTIDDARTLISNEIRGILTVAQSEKRDAWLTELRTMQILYKDIQ